MLAGYLVGFRGAGNTTCGVGSGVTAVGFVRVTEGVPCGVYIAY